jgi:hypothetical protein
MGLSQKTENHKNGSLSAGIACSGDFLEIS